MNEVYLKRQAAHPAALIVGGVCFQQHIAVGGVDDEGEAVGSRTDELSDACDVDQIQSAACVRAAIQETYSGGHGCNSEEWLARQGQPGNEVRQPRNL